MVSPARIVPHMQALNDAIAGTQAKFCGDVQGMAMTYGTWWFLETTASVQLT